MGDDDRMADEQVVVLVRTKNKEAFEVLVKRYEHKLMNYALYLINNKEKAADVVQETLIKAYVNLNGFDTKKKFSSWVYRIAHNEAMNAIRKYHREKPLNDEFDMPANQNPEEELDKKEIINRTLGCLKKMTVMYSEPLALYYLEDKSYEEISDILRIPIGTVGTRINRAKIIMKKICQTKN